MLTRYDYIFAQEFIHALGYGAHDNGVDVYQTEAFSKRVRNDLAYIPAVGNTLSYGDCFSVMGSGDCSLMLSPSAKEVLGVTLDAVSVYQDQTVELNENQVLKVFLEETTGITGFERIVTYLTILCAWRGRY